MCDCEGLFDVLILTTIDLITIVFTNLSSGVLRRSSMKAMQLGSDLAA